VGSSGSSGVEQYVQTPPHLVGQLRSGGNERAHVLLLHGIDGGSAPSRRPCRRCFALHATNPSPQEQRRPSRNSS
jgi:hypothetical protein